MSYSKTRYSVFAFTESINFWIIYCLYFKIAFSFLHLKQSVYHVENFALPLLSYFFLWQHGWNCSLPRCLHFPWILAVFILRSQETNLKEQMFKKKVDSSKQLQALLLANDNNTGIPQWICVFFQPLWGRVGLQATERSRYLHWQFSIVKQTENLENNFMLFDSYVVFLWIMRVLIWIRHQTQET